MRITVVGNGWSPAQGGGLNRYVTNLTAALGALGVRQQVLVLEPTGAGHGVVVPVAHRSDAVVRRQLGFWRHMRRSASETNLAVVHFAFNGLAALMFRKTNIVVHFHGPWAAESRAMGESPFIVAIKKRLELLLYRRAKHLITLSDAFRDILISDYCIDATKITVVSPGVDLKQFTDCNHASANPPASKYVVCVRRLVPRMGLDILLRAWSALGTKNTSLLIVGDGPQRNELEMLAEELKISQSVQFMGYVSDERLAQLYSGAIISVVPTLELEGFGLVALESLAAGTPVIATRNGGLGEFLAKICPNLLVSSGDVAELAAKLGEAINGVVALPTADDCRTVAGSYSWEKSAREVAAIYEAACVVPVS